MTYMQPGSSPEDRLRIPLAAPAADQPARIEPEEPDPSEVLRIRIEPEAPAEEERDDLPPEPAPETRPSAPASLLYAPQINVGGDNEGEINGIVLRMMRDLGVIELDEKSIRNRVKKSAVAPGRFEQVLREVTDGERSLVVLVADADHGRDLLAEAILCARDELDFKGIGALSKTDLTGDRLAWSRKTAWKVDLTDVEGFRANASVYLRRLEALATPLESQESVLVAIVPKSEVSDDLVKTFGFVIDLHREEFRLSRPALIRRHLGNDRPAVGTPESWEEFAAAQGILDDLPPSEAVRFSTIVLQIGRTWTDLNELERDRHRQKYRKHPLIATPTPRDEERTQPAPKGEDFESGSHGGDDEWIAQQLALEAFQSWDDLLTDWNETHEGDAELAAFQVAAAVLSTESVDDVVEESRRLRNPDYKPRWQQRRFEGRGARLLAKRSMARIVNDKVVFDRPGLGNAVLWYYWQDRKPEREGFIQWMVECLSKRTGKPEAAAALEKRIGDFAIELAAQHGDRSVLKNTVTTFAADSKTKEAGTRLLLKASQSEDIGRDVRIDMRTWASDTTAPRELRDTVAAVCSHAEFLSAYPSMALVRISHLVHQDDMEGSETLSAAIPALVRDPNLVQGIVNDLAASVETRSGNVRDRNVGFFLKAACVVDDETCMPVLQEHGFSSAEDLDQVAKLWGAVIRRRKPDDFQKPLGLWLDGAATTSRPKELVELLQLAILASPEDWRPAVRQLFEAVTVWKNQHASQPDLVAVLAEELSKLNEAFIVAKPTESSEGDVVDV
jgi:hypothetical protein